MVGADARITHVRRRLRGPTSILGPRVFLAVLVFVGVPGAFAAPCLENERVENGVCAPCTGGGTRAAGDDPAFGDTSCAFPDRTALRTALDNCIAVDATGRACCNHGADCGAAGTVEMAYWDVSLVTDMNYLFSEKRSFNADISRWDVSSVTDMYKMFYDARQFNADISRWDVSSVTRMYFMFHNAYAFNADISRWDTSSVTNMGYMFYYASKFNADISRWDTSSVTNMGYMFQYATAWKSRFHNCGYQSSSHPACSEVTSYASSSGSDHGPPAAWVRKDDACDASTPPDNGGGGNCTDTLWSGGLTVLSLVDISATISSDQKFWGAAAASNGKIIFAPYNADGVGVFDPSDNSFALVDISATISSDRKFWGAAAASNGKIIFAPNNADGVGVFDPSDNSFALVDISATISSDWKFEGAAAASNGKIIFAPYSADGVGVFDPSDNSFALVDISATISSDWKFEGAAAASNGKIIFAPFNADGVGVFDPSDNSFALVDISATISSGEKFSGAAAASNGKIIFAPYYADGVGVFDPSDNSFALVDISATISLDGKFIGAAAASNGKIIFAPTNADGVGVFDPSDNSFALVDISATISSDWKFMGAAAASNGKIIFAPHNADGVGVYETLSDFHFCVPTCNAGYVLQGVTSCTNRVLTEKALCVWPIADGTELKAAVDACLDAVPSGEKCCSSDPRCWYNETAMRRCGALGCSDMPDWDVSQVMDAQNLFAGRSSFLQDLAGWTFSDDAITTGMFTGADTWLTAKSRTDGSDSTDGPPGAWTFIPCLENERVENGVCAPCTGGGTRAAGDDPAFGDTGCTFPDSTALKTAVDNCISVDATGRACCSRGADCGAAGTTEMADWDVSLVTDMSWLFYNKGSFNADISRWDVSSVTNMYMMFYGAYKFNADISRWDTSSVTNMYQMFAYANVFNADISRWDVSSVTNMERMFRNAQQFNADMSRWDVSSVTNMYMMFYGANVFNADISRWDVSSVTSMESMFYDAYAFNADISRWDVSSVTTMRHMFQNAYAFNRDISRWTTSGSACCSWGANNSPWFYMFHSATAFTARYTSLPMGDNSCSDCHLRWNPSMLTRKDDACDASTPPDNGGVGNCTDTLWSGGSAVLSLVDISATISSDGKFLGAAAASNGKIIFAPYSADGVGVFDPSDNSFALVDIGATISFNSKFAGAAAASNGKIIFAPTNADSVGVFDPSDDSFALVDISATISSDYKYVGAAAASNGKIIFAPWNADGVGVFDPSDNSFALVDISATISSDAKFRGAAAASNGKIIFAPYNADGVGVFDPSDNSFALVDISATISFGGRFRGATAASNGKIIFAPGNADGVGLFDPSDNSFALVDISATISSDAKFEGAAAASNGKIIFAPFNADGVGVFDPSDNSFALVDIGATISSNAKFIGAAAASNGKIIFAPHHADGVGVYETLSDFHFCVPTCNAGYVLKGVTSCTNRVLTEALCVWPIANGTELKTAVDACLHAVPSGEKCCSSDPRCWYDDTAMRRCGAVGCSDMPDWDVSQVMDAQNLFAGRSSFYQDLAGWTFSDDAITTGMFTDADTWLTVKSRKDGSDSTDGPPGAWTFIPCLENERVENGLCAPCTGGGTRAAGDDPAFGDTACAFPDNTALKTAVDNCIRVNGFGTACCSRGADCGAAGTAKMADWDVSLVTDMSSLFNGKGSFDADISRWDVSSVTNMGSMFRDASTFNTDISRWDVSSVTNMYRMFYQASKFNADISRWDVSSVTNMGYMFQYAGQFNADISRWDVSSVTNMEHMFYNAYAFNADISWWDVSSVTNMGYMFEYAYAFNADISRWDVSSVWNMGGMFYQASKFNADISRWDTSSVTNMGYMFYRANAFNADISRWDVSSVTNMEQMFYQAYAFDADITRWDTSMVTYLFQMFYSATAWKSRFHNCGYQSSSHQACGEVASYASSSGSEDGPPAAWVRKDDACDASTPPDNGGGGNCTDTLWSGGSAVFSLVDISATISSDWKFRGAAAASNGKIIFAPYNADGVGVFDPSDNSFALVDISATISSDYKFIGAAAASNGKIIFAPTNADGVGVFDPSDNSFALVDISATISSDYKFSGAAAASNGKIIFAPYNADGVGVFDPSNNSFALVDISATISSDLKFAGAAAASNGKIIFAPYKADGVGVFDPSDNSFALVDISATISSDYKFMGAAAASNGKIIFAPANADGVGVFEPSDNSFALVDISATISSDWKFRGAAAASNGKIIFAPAYADGVGVFDPSENSFALVDIGATISSDAIFAGAAAASNGKIIFAPLKADGVGVYETLSDFHFCVPTCNAGYVLQGVTSCTNRVLTEKAVCVWPIADRAELNAAVATCLDAVPSGEKCCSSDPRCWYNETAMRRCGALGCSDMPDWDVSQVTDMSFLFEGETDFDVDISRWNMLQVMDAQGMFQGASSFYQDVTGWTFSDDAITTGMFTGADTWLSHLVPDEVNTTDGPPSHWNKLPCLENERVESGWCVACRIGWIKAAGGNPHGENTACSLPFPSEGPHAYFACSYRHTCAVSVGGEMKCWGNGDFGQLGYGDTRNRGDGPGEMGDNLPILDVGGSSLAFKVKAVSVGISHTCAILNDGSVKCWGSGANGRLGYGDTQNRGDGPGEMDNLPSVDLGSGRSAKFIATGESHTCAILDDGSVKCWGSGANGRLGYGDTQYRGDGPGEMGDNLPSVDLGSGRSAKFIAAGESHTCAILDDGSVKCWGSGANGRLGYGDTQNRGDGAGEMGDNLRAIHFSPTVKTIVTGKAFTCALLYDGSVKCWGLGQNGQLGYGDTQNRGDGTGVLGKRLPSVDLGSGRSAKFIAAGGDHTCAILDDDSVKCWGQGQNGQLGYGDTLSRGDSAGEMGDNLPSVDLGSGRSAKFIAAGESHTCAILDDGSAKCWGSGANGRLGYGDTQYRGDGPGEMGDNLRVVDLGRFEFAEPWPFVPHPCAQMKSYGFNVDFNRCSARDYRSHCPRPMDVKTNADDWPSLPTTR